MLFTTALWLAAMLYPIVSMAENLSDNRVVQTGAVHSQISVKQILGSKAILTLQRKDENNELKIILNCNAHIGKNGLGKETEGDMKTPVGEFGILYTFGIKPNPGTKLEYLQITDSHYACDDACEFYNKIIDTKNLNHECKGEHMTSYVPQYNYGIFLDYNKECVYPKGSAIFIHCHGKKDYTAGCISVSEKDMITILKNVDANTKIKIGE